MPTSDKTSLEVEWADALDIYAMPGIPAACLLMQDRLGVDVTVLLHAMHVWSRQGVALDEDALAQADALVRPWRSRVTGPLRALRRELKAGFGPVPVELVAATRERIQAAELSAELGAFAILSLHVGGVGVRGATEVPPAESPVTRVAHFYALRNKRHQALRGVEVQDAIQRLKSLVQPV